MNGDTLLTFLNGLCVEDGLWIIPIAVNEWIGKAIDFDRNVVSEDVKEYAHQILSFRKFPIQLSTSRDYGKILLLEFNALCGEKRIGDFSVFTRQIAKPSPLNIDQKSEAVRHLTSLLCDIQPKNVLNDLDKATTAWAASCNENDLRNLVSAWQDSSPSRMPSAPRKLPQNLPDRECSQYIFFDLYYATDASS